MRILWDIEPCRVSGNRTKTHHPVSRIMMDAALVDAKARSGNPQTRRGRADEHLACGGANGAHDREEGRDRFAVAGEHPLILRVPVCGIEIGPFKRDARPVGAEFVGEHQRKGGLDALSHFRLGEHDRHHVVWIDAQPGIDEFVGE